VKSLFKLFN